MGKITSFSDLVAWQNSHKLALLVYKTTGTYPKEETFCLVTQMRRCAVSVTSNIAEGFSRRNLKEKQQFYFIALGSVTELQNQLMLSRDLGYITNKEFEVIYSLTIESHKLINGLVKSASTRIS